jgi:hypothetical protein
MTTIGKMSGLQQYKECLVCFDEWEPLDGAENESGGS